MRLILEVKAVYREVEPISMKELKKAVNLLNKGKATEIGEMARVILKDDGECARE